MEDILLLQMLRKKGVISESNVHESDKPVLSEIETPIYLSQDTNITEQKAKELVSKMYHTENGKKYIGEKFDIYKAKEICERYKGMLPKETTPCEVYVAINSQYHDYCSLFKSWFTDGIEQKIIESAMVFWFMDNDYKHGNKVNRYFAEH